MSLDEPTRAIVAAAVKYKPAKQIASELPAGCLMTEADVQKVLEEPRIQKEIERRREEWMRSLPILDRGWRLMQYSNLISDPESTIDQKLAALRAARQEQAQMGGDGDQPDFSKPPSGPDQIDEDDLF